jgi:hypothetical protein
MMFEISNCHISGVGNKRNEAIIELAKAIQTLAQCIQTDHTQSYGMYIEAPKEEIAKPTRKK